MMENIVHVAVKMPACLDRRTRIAAAELRVSKSEVMRRALREYLDRRAAGGEPENRQAEAVIERQPATIDL